jgi:hypothetical protein
VKKKLTHDEARQLLRDAGVNFREDYHALRHSDQLLIADVARMAGYRKRRDAPGSTSRMYFQFLSRMS